MCKTSGAVLAFSALTLRTELSLVLSSLLVVSIGLAGGTAIYQSARTMRRELTTEYQLFAENRAFALRDNFEILEDELKRLALLPEMNPADPDLLQEEQILAGAHEHSVLYNTAVLLLDARRPLRPLGARPVRVPRAVVRRSPLVPRRCGAAAPGPLFRITDEPNAGAHAEDRPAARARRDASPARWSASSRSARTT